MNASFREAVEAVEAVDQVQIMVLYSHSADSWIRKVALWRMAHNEAEWVDVLHTVRATYVKPVKWGEGPDSQLRQVEGVRQVQASRGAD